MRKRKLTFEFQDDKDDISGYFDVDKLDKIVYNLLSNAAKYTAENGWIKVGLHYDETNDKLYIVVANSGNLISKEKIVHLFDRFYEGDYRRFHTIGTGIGLSFTKDLVQIHHGSIDVTSEADTGNIFTVILPISRAAYQDDETDEVEQTMNAPLLSMEDTIAEERDFWEIRREEEAPTLLLVEDNEELLSIMVRLFSKYYTVFSAIDGKKAIQVLEKENIDLVISDIMMPEMDGVELCKYLKTQFEYCHIPIILLTAKRNDEDRVSGYESGADSYICKPLNLAMLHVRIENLLTKKKRTCVDFRKQLVFEAKELNYTSMDEEFIQKAIDCVYAHLDDCEFELSQFVAEMGTSRSTMTAKLKSLTGLTPSAFISNVRLNAACKLLDEGKKIRIADLAYAVGFNDPKYFSTCFKKKFNFSPSEYLMK